MTQQASSSANRADSAPSPSNANSPVSTDIYSYSVGDKEIVLSNGTVAIPDNDLFGPNPNINVVDSSGVRIGNDTVFNGDVTLIQHVYAPGERGAVGHAAEFEKEVRVVQERRAPWKWRRHRKALTCALVVGTFVGTAVLVALQVRAAPNTDETEPSAPTTIPTTTTTTASEMPGNIRDIYFFNRTRWGGRPPAERRLLDEPVPLVIVKHTGGDVCADPYGCFEFMQTSQAADVADGEPDIRYNFVVGGDGNVYVGRGWGVRNAHLNDTIDIAYVGNYSVAAPTQKMITAGKEIVIKGVLYGNLAADVRVVCHNQTEATDSPGEYLYREVVEWTAWYSPESVTRVRRQGLGRAQRRPRRGQRRRRVYRGLFVGRAAAERPMGADARFDRALDQRLPRGRLPRGEREPHQPVGTDGRATVQGGRETPLQILQRDVFPERIRPARSPRSKARQMLRTLLGHPVRDAIEFPRSKTAVQTRPPFSSRSSVRNEDDDDHGDLRPICLFF